MITVYSKPNCVQCNATYRALDKQGLPYTVVDVTVDPDAYDFVQSLGYLQAPVVVVDSTTHWGGHRIDRLKALSAQTESLATKAS